MWKRRTLIYLLLVTFTDSKETAIESISWRLDRTYDYILKNYDLVNVDCVFGVVLSQAFLSETDENVLKGAKELKTKGARIISKSVARLESVSPFNKLMIQAAFDPVKWEKKRVFREGLLDPDTKVTLSRPDFLKALANQPPIESISDECLGEVLKGPDPSTKLCKISSLCRQIMDGPEAAVGYSATHRLIYLQFARLSGCVNHSKSLEGKIRKRCSYLYNETKLIQDVGLAKRLHDLLFEEITLCGMEGFAEFMQPVFLNLAAALQHENGCYGYPGFRSKRTANLIGAGCIDHTTGLGASVLSLFLKFYTSKQ